MTPASQPLKGLYTNTDYRHNFFEIDDKEDLKLLNCIKTQSQSVACIVEKRNLIKSKDGMEYRTHEISTL